MLVLLTYRYSRNTSSPTKSCMCFFLILSRVFFSDWQPPLLFFSFESRFNTVTGGIVSYFTYLTCTTFGLLFSPSGLLPLRLTGTCPVTTDLIMAMKKLGQHDHRNNVRAVEKLRGPMFSTNCVWSRPVRTELRCAIHWIGGAFGWR